LHRHNKWVPQLEKELREAWQSFLQGIEPQHVNEFTKQIEHCRNKPGFSNIIL
jgi:hypothetical protein